MTKCPIEGCLGTGIEEVIVDVIGPGMTARTVLTLCTFHRRQLEPITPRPVSIGFDPGPADDVATKVAQVHTEWKRAHPRVGDRRG